MLKPKQIQCLELMLEAKLTDKDIAKSINITQKTICAWKKEKEFMDEYEKQMRGCLQYVAAKAFRKQLALLDARSEMVAYLAAKDLMDRAGFNPIDKVDMNANVDMDLNVKVEYGDEE